MNEKCIICEEKKNEKQFYTRNTKKKISYICKECENKLYNKIETECGGHLALYGMCMGMNVPFIPELLPEPKEFCEVENKWEFYNKLLIDNLVIVPQNDEIATFFDGITNILKVFGKELTQKDTAKYIQFENERIEKLPGTEEQRERWGTQAIWKGLNMTAKVYEELDNQYFAMLGNFSGMTVTEQMENTLIDVSKMRVAANYLMSLGDDSFTKLLKAADDRLGSEQMRKKDEKPMEEMRIDALKIALENAGLMENGELLTYEETVNVLMNSFVKKKKYNYSVDVADQIIFDVLNNMRANADVQLLTDLPEDAMVDDEWGEFEPEETEREKEAKKYAGLTKIHRDKKGE